MRRNRRFACVVAAVLCAIALVPAAAQAADISDSYCHNSLMGLTGQAPDNDVGGYWYYLQYLGYTVYGAVEHSTDAGQYWQRVHEVWRFGTAQGNVYQTFSCWRDAFSAAGSYHDGQGWV